MLKRSHTLALAGVVAIALTISGCGNRMPANAPVDEAESSDSATTPAAPAAVPTPVPAAPVATAPTTPAYTAPLTGSLVVSNVQKEKTGGFLGIGKKMKVSGSVLNTSNMPLSGVLKIDFKKNKGIINKSVVTSATKTQAIATLQPGQSFPFSITADSSGDDDAEVTVDTNQPVQAMMQQPAAMMTAPTGYGAPVAGTYGSAY